MKVTEKQQKEIEVITDVICDSCGKSCITKDGGNYEYMTLKANWGYGTKKDLEQWSAQVCEKCVDEKFSFIKFVKEDIEFQTYLGTESSYMKNAEETMNSIDFKGEFSEGSLPDDSLKK